MNRLNLDFSIPTAEKRQEYLDKYLQRQEFKKRPLSPEELEMCANYVLWGKDKDGYNAVQKKEIEIQGKNSTWNKKEVESLDALLESPTFNENIIIQPSEARLKVTKEVFSRKEALEKAPENIKPLFEALFREIDELDLIINFYELAHNKRKNPPRAELLKVFTDEEIEQLKERSTHINAYQYLKMRHQMVELRREQFTLRDSYSSRIQIDNLKKIPTLPNKIVFDADIPVYPLGLKGMRGTDQFFIPYEKLNPALFSKKEISRIIQKYWAQQPIAVPRYFDFENTDHIYNLVHLLSELSFDSFDKTRAEDTLINLIDTFYYYLENSELNDVQRHILKLKINHKKNAEIAEIVNKEYNKNYTVNYISTIFRQKIIKKLAESATYHKELILNLPFDEEFKRCNTCGQIYLRSPHNFVKKTRSKDGFTNRCKYCDKKERKS